MEAQPRHPRVACGLGHGADTLGAVVQVGRCPSLGAAAYPTHDYPSVALTRTA